MCRGALYASFLALVCTGRAQAEFATLAGPLPAPELDGHLDDAVWMQAQPLSGFRQVNPVTGAPPGVATQLRLLHDGRTLFIAIRAEEPARSAIVARQMRRDADLSGDDHVAIVLDPVGAGRNGYVFRVNANGAHYDGLVFDGSAERQDWDAIWEARAAIGAQGWTAELALPLSALSGGGVGASWGLNVERYRAASGERLRWAGVLADRNVTSLPDAGRLSGVPRVAAGGGLRIKATLRFANSDGDEGEDRELEPGLDAFWRLRPDTTASFSLNTDFAESEVDERQVNLTRFDLFFPEKREFFLQDAGLFSFGGLSYDVLPFFSRRVGLTEDGRPLALDAGVKLTHESEHLEAGMLAVRVEAPPGGTASQVGVLRAATGVGTSRLGVIGTLGNPQGSSGSSVRGLDYRYQNPRVGGGKTLTIDAWTQTARNEGTGAGSAHGIAIDWPNLGWTGNLRAQRIDENYAPALGFVQENGIADVAGELGYWWRSGRGNSVTPRLEWQSQRGLEDERLYRQLALEIFLANILGDSIFSRVAFERERLIENFEILPGLIVAAGDYSYESARLWLNLASERVLSGWVSLRAGEFYDGEREDYELNASWRPSRHFGMALRGQRTDLRLSAGDARVHVAALRLDVSPATRLVASLLTQWDDVTEQLGANLRLRWTLAPGRDVFLSLNRLLDREDGFAARARGESLKLAWNWQF